MTPLHWYVFWLSFLSALYERRPSAQVTVLADWRRDHPPRQPVPPESNGRAA